MSTRPSRQVCPLCAQDDDEFLTWEPIAPGLWQVTCTSPLHPEPYRWQTTGVGVLDASGHEGLCHQLGVYETLLGTFVPGEPFVEYGIVEHRFALAAPHAYRVLVDTYNHKALSPGQLQVSASAVIGGALGWLRERGGLVSRRVRATGFWSYNSDVTAWRLPGEDASTELLTWLEFAKKLEVDPDAWPSLGGTTFTDHGRRPPRGSRSSGDRGTGSWLIRAISSRQSDGSGRILRPSTARRSRSDRCRW